MSEELLVQFSDIKRLDDQLPKESLPDMEVQEIAKVDGQEPSDKFAQLMQQNKQLTAQATQQSGLRPSPIQEASRLGGTLSVEEAKNLSASLTEFRNRQRARLESIMQKLSTTNDVQLRPSVQKHLDAKLQTITNQVDSITNKLNLPPIDEISYNNSDFLSSLQVGDGEMFKPVEKFFNFIVRGEKQLYNLESEIDSAFAHGKEMPNPGVMLKLQLKMTHVSQQLELFTSMLNKGLESSKTVFNTQI